MQSHRWQKMASVPKEIRERHIKETIKTEKELTSASVINLATGKPHVPHNSGNNQWYTPIGLLDAATAVLGCIDLDPASANVANKVVGGCGEHNV